jgi:hypothetical protein
MNHWSVQMIRIVASLVVILAIAATVFSGTQLRTTLSAPTYYIAANTEYRDSEQIWLRGASNLPAGAVLVVDVYNYVGEGSQTLSVRAQPRVGKDGFFEATLVPLPKMQFKHNIVCSVLFSPDYPEQDTTVTTTVGKHGEQLGFPRNPQTIINSGDRVSLMAAIHVE